MKFTKMQGLGNDYIYLDCTRSTPNDLPGLAARLSDRHFGVGADGLICVEASERADFRMRMFNADGSEGAMCGNGIRCLGRFVLDKGLTRRRELTVETGAGCRRLELHSEDDGEMTVTVEMGEPLVQPPRVLTVLGRAYTVYPVSMGNPHAVLFLEGVDGLDLRELGPALERHPAFPGRVNAEFVEVPDPAHLYLRVWERGSGETLACGTGACAALAAGVLSGRTGRAAAVRLPGGTLDIRWDEGDGHIYMTGPAVTVFEGTVDI